MPDTVFVILLTVVLVYLAEADLQFGAKKRWPKQKRESQTRKY